jgi:hypothetical protein
MSDNYADDIVAMTGLGVTAGIGLATINMIERQMDPKKRRKRQRRR